MSENLYSWVSTTLARADAMLEEAQSLENNSKGKKAKKKKRVHTHEHKITRAQAMQHVCSAYFKVN